MRGGASGVPHAMALAAALAVTSFAGGARGETRCDAILGGSRALSDADADARLTFVRETMRAQASYAKTWTWAWSAIGFGLAAGQYGLMAIVPAHERFEQAFEGTAALYIPAAIALQPLRVRGDDERLEEFLTETEVEGPGGSHGGATCLRLARAEELLASSAADEALHTNWFQHTLTIVLSGAYAAVLGVAFKNVANVIVNGGGAVILGEAQLLTTPTGAVSALERYQKGDLTMVAPTPPRVSWTLAPLGVGPGLAIVARF